MVVTSGFAVACSSPSTKMEPADSGSVKSDASSDAGTSADVVVDVGPCVPGSVSKFSPTPVAPLVSPSCSDTNDIPQFIGNCYSDAGTEKTCVTWKDLGTNFPCNACLNTTYGENSVSPPPALLPEPAPSWGAAVSIFNPGESDWLNVGGCVRVADPDAGHDCGTALTSAFECEFYACAGVPGCSVPEYPAAEQPRLGELQKCFAAAASGVCSTYADSAKSACASYTDAGDGGPAAFCFRAATDSAALTTLLTQQCGGGDGGGYKN
jgi:hypothetical protein